jgi:hypothetical protein
MAKKKRKTIKIEIPIPDVRTPKSGDLEKLKKGTSDKFEEIKISLPEKVGDIKESIPEKEKIIDFVQVNKKLVSGLVVVIAAIIVVSFFLLSYQPMLQGNGNQTATRVTRTETVTVTVPLNLSFDEYLENYVDYEDQQITVTGFIKRDIKWALGGGGMGTYTYAVIDDFDNEINLIDLTSKQKSVFPPNGTSEDLYRVSGLVKLKYMGFDLDVLEVVQTERPTKVVEKQVTIEEFV